MAKIRKVGSGGLQIGDKVVYKDDPDEVGIVEGFSDHGEVEVRWNDSPVLSWEHGFDLIKYQQN